MPSFISNSNNSCWGKSWILALIITAMLLGGLEYYWRSSGHQPAIVDDQRLWAGERSKVGDSRKEIILLGSSRMQTDISMPTLRRLAPDQNVINLSINGTCANASLHDLAEDDKFAGTVIMETTSECLMFGYDREISQQSFIDYYHRVYNLNMAMNRQIATLMQRSFVVIDPYLNLIKVIGNLLVKKELRASNYVTTYEDRSCSADYTKIDAAHNKAVRLEKTERHYKRQLARISSKLLQEQLIRVNTDVEKIINRGGQVIFVRFPVSEEHWDMDEKYFPRDEYWDKIVMLTRVQIRHFKDMDVIKDMRCPDSSHLDARDTETFTRLLFNELFGKKASEYGDIRPENSLNN